MLNEINMQATLHKISGGFSGGTQYRLEILIGVSKLGKDDEALLSEAKATSKEILEKIYGIGIDVEKIKIEEHFSL